MSNDDAVGDAVIASAPGASKGNRGDGDSVYGQCGGELTLALAGDASSGFTTTFEVGLEGRARRPLRGQPPRRPAVSRSPATVPATLPPS